MIFFKKRNTRLATINKLTNPHTEITTQMKETKHRIGMLITGRSQKLSASATILIDQLPVSVTRFKIVIVVINWPIQQEGCNI